MDLEQIWNRLRTMCVPRMKQRRRCCFLALVLVVGTVLIIAYHTLNRPPVPTAKVSHACIEIDEPPFPHEKWSAFMSALQRYKEFHNAGVKQLRTMPATQVRTLTWSCKEPGIVCAGIGDQLRRIAVTFLLSVVSQRVFTVYWSKDDVTMQTLQPNEIDWTFFKEQHRDRDILSFSKKEDYLELSRLLHSNKQHITISHEVTMSYFGPFEEPTLKKELDELGITQFFDEDENAAWVFVTGTILRYLFKFPHEVIAKLERAQESLGIHDQMYLAIHIRTGFPETDFFDPHKAFKDDSSWEQSIDCSLQLADYEIELSSPVLLVTDSYEVKRWALENYGDRVQVSNTVLYHVALKKTWNMRAKIAVGTWVDFLLLARARIFVHSTSGFAAIAGAFCSNPRQYGLPDCQ